MMTPSLDGTLSSVPLKLALFAAGVMAMLTGVASLLPQAPARATRHIHLRVIGLIRAKKAGGSARGGGGGRGAVAFEQGAHRGHNFRAAQDFAEQGGDVLPLEQRDQVHVGGG